MKNTRIILVLSLFFYFNDCKKNENIQQEEREPELGCYSAEKDEFGYGKPCVYKKKEVHCEKMKQAHTVGKLQEFLQGKWYDGYPGINIYLLTNTGNFTILCKGLNDPENIAKKCGSGTFLIKDEGLVSDYQYYDTRNYTLSKEIICEAGYADGIGYGARIKYSLKDGSTDSIWTPIDHPEPDHEVKINLVNH